MSTTIAATTTAAAMPEMADFIAEVQKPDGSTMTMAIAVEGENVVAYATNGTNNEAYFFGTQKDGQMELMSMYADEVKASFDGSNINGEMAMNDEGATVQKFAATRVEAPAGMYTAARDNSRATWIVRPNNTTVGVMDNSAPGDHKVTDANAAKDQAFKDSVRQMRLDRQLQQAPQLQMDTMEADMNGSMMPVTRVTGSMSFCWPARTRTRSAAHDGAPPTRSLLREFYPTFLAVFTGRFITLGIAEPRSPRCAGDRPHPGRACQALGEPDRRGITPRRAQPRTDRADRSRDQSRVA